MTALQLLHSIRRAGLHDDEARVLLSVAAGARRYADIAAAAGLKETQLRKMLAGLTGRGMLEISRHEDGAAGRGRCSVYSLSGAGVGTVHKVLTPDPLPEAKRPLPCGVPLGFDVRAWGTCFLNPGR